MQNVIIIEQKNILRLEYIKITIGAIFCQVINIKALIQFNPSITSGNQKWKGAAPIFVNKEELKISVKISWLYINFIDIIIIENNKIVDAKAWVIKYFIAASDSNEFFVLLINGIKDKRLISNPIHIPIQEYEEIEINVPENKNIVNIYL